MVAAFVARNCSGVRGREEHVVLGLGDAKLGVRSVRVVLALGCGCGCGWSGGVGQVVWLGVFRGVLGVLGVVVCSRVSGACWVVAVMRKVVVESANTYSRRRTPRNIIRGVSVREILFAE